MLASTRGTTSRFSRVSRMARTLAIPRTCAILPRGRHEYVSHIAASISTGTYSTTMERKRRMTDQFKMGEMSARLDVGDQRHLENTRNLEAIKLEQTQTNKKLQELVDAMTLVRGGFRTLMAVGVVSASIGAFISNVFHWWKGP